MGMPNDGILYGFYSITPRHYLIFERHHLGLDYPSPTNLLPPLQMPWGMSRRLPAPSLNVQWLGSLWLRGRAVRGLIASYVSRIPKCREPALGYPLGAARLGSWHKTGNYKMR